MSDKAEIPTHIAVIMDGNGRWAKKHALSRISGHEKGADAVRTVIKASRELGIQYLTLYAFSTENWSRPVQEVNSLMNLLARYLSSELKEMHQNGISLKIIGDIERLKPSLRKKIQAVVDETANNCGMVLTLALNYGGREEIVRAIRIIMEDIRTGRLPGDELDVRRFSRYLFTAGLPDPDLLIRTSGELRLSNFLLWQSAYTEFYFTDVLWPDFGKKDLLLAIEEYRKRERRYGKTTEQIINGKSS